MDVNLIVLLKQVPDIASIPPDAWNHETGTLKRAMLDNMLNQFDLHALAAAVSLRKYYGGKGRIVCMSMGIRSAADVLLEAMARGADEGILLNDAAFAGADTSATATALAAAIRKVQAERFGGSRDYIILGGMQSTDGDTAQVPAQIAEAMGVDSVAYVCGIEYAEPVVFSRIGGAGMEKVQLSQLPAVLTLTDCTEPPYPTLELTRAVRNRRQPVTIWTAADLGLDAAAVGAKGSWTQVVRIFSPMQEARQCWMAGEAGELVRLIDKKAKAVTGAVAMQAVGRRPQAPAYEGEVFVYVEMQEGKPAQVVMELLSEARVLAETLGEEVGAVVAGQVTESVTRQLIEGGADKVYVADDSRLSDYDTVAHASAVASIVLERNPQIMLFGATPLGRELAPRVAYACRCGLTADCTQLSIGEHAGTAGILLQTRPALGGNIMATIVSKASRTQMATVRPGVFAAGQPDTARKGAVVEHKCRIRQGGLKVVARGLAVPKSELAAAQIIVSGGGGVRGEANFTKYLSPLAVALGKRFGVKATVGASRRAVEHSYATRQMQVGQTGQTVSPMIYVAVGISGAVQHISAIQKSRVIVAINPDANAPIFKTADVGIVGKVETVVPAMLAALEAC